MNNIFGNFGCGCNKGCDNSMNNNCFDPCWLILLISLCGCQIDCIDPCTIILLFMFMNCFGQGNGNHCCNN